MYSIIEHDSNYRPNSMYLGHVPNEISGEPIEFGGTFQPSGRIWISAQCSSGLRSLPLEKPRE